MYNMSMNDRQISQLEIVKAKVRQLLGGDTSGHADDHVERVALLAERFANECSESVNLQEVLLTAWLHDVDDYKLVGKTQAEKLTNAVNIMAQAEIADDLSQVVLENIAAIGYSKRLTASSRSGWRGNWRLMLICVMLLVRSALSGRWFMLVIMAVGFLILKSGRMSIWRRTNITLMAIRMIPTDSLITSLRNC